jgi:hypothetical protein
LSGANLSRANLFEADVSRAWLNGANLSGANLSRANLSETKFEPRELPNVPGIQHARSLSEMTFHSSPEALFTLRESFKKAGLFRHEREVTYAIRHSQTRKDFKIGGLAGKIRSAFNFIFFELTTKWGMLPGRALCIMGVLLVFFAIPYSLALRCTGRSGIWRIRDKDRAAEDMGGDTPERVTVRGVKALSMGFYFSILSAFRIGWRVLNMRNWIARIVSREYTFQATGWVRTVSGIQSLLSMYLLAIWALTYFGRPF